MTGNVRQTAQERVCRPIVAAHEQDTVSDGTGPQNAPEGTVDMKSVDNLREYVLTAPSICSTTRAILVGYIDNIEREVEELRDRDYRNGMEDGEMAAERDGWVAQHEDAMAEHGWVRKSKEHVVSYATIEVTPHIDWSRMADELNEFVEIVRGMAGGAE